MLLTSLPSTNDYRNLSSERSARPLHDAYRLSNGVELDLGAASIDELSTVVQMFGRMPCSGSTKI